MPDWLLVLTLIVVGYILLAIEVVIIPGFGLIGIMGLGSLILASYFAYTKLNLVLGLITSVGSLILIALSWRVLPKTGLWRKLRLEKQEKKEEGFQPFKGNLGNLEGKEGTSLSPLRPMGVCLIEGRRVDAICKGGLFIDKDRPIKVIKTEANRVVVEELNPSN